MKTKFTILLLSIWANFLFSQTVTTGAGASNYVQNVLVGGGVTVSNITINTNDPDVIGEFSNCASTNIGLDNGVILACGDVNLALGPNSSGSQGATVGSGGDADLQQLLGSSFSINDAVILEFDFIPLSNHVDFDYVFASEEFPEFVNSSFNDVFGFFVSGPGISGPFSNNSMNVALIPGTTNPVTIDNIYPTAYYVDNTNGQTIEYDGFTTVLTASFDVTPCVVYHIKIALGDAGDSAYDSAIFLKASSFSSNGVSFDLSYDNSNGTNSTVIEGCGNAILSFTLETPLPNDTTIYYTIGGTATNGTDYNNLNGEITFLAGEDSTWITITPTLDGIVEGNETIELYIPTVCGMDTVNVIIEDGYQVTSDFAVTSPICQGENSTITYTGNASDTATYNWDFAGGTIVSGSGQGPYEITWSAPGTYNVTLEVISENGCTNSTSSMPVVVNQIPTADFNTQVICEGDTSTITYIGNASASASYYWIFPTGCPNTTVVSGIGQGPYQIHFGTGSSSCSPAQIILTVSENGCISEPDTNYVTIHPPGTTGCCEIPHPYAGADDNICGEYYTLNADPVTVGNSGSWILINGPGNATFSPVYSENAQVHVDVLGEYTFAWHEVSGGCENWDTLTINFVPFIDAFAGNDTAFCDNAGQMNAQIISGNSGHWIPQAGVTFTPSTSPNANITVNIAGDYTLGWVETNGTCSDTDYVDITFYVTPNAGLDVTYTVCAQSINISPSSGADTNFVHQWYSNSMGDMFTPSDTNIDVTWTIMPWGSASSHIDTAIYIITNGACSDYAYHIVTFTQPSDAILINPGDNSFTCENTYTMQANLASGTSGYWTYQDSRIDMNDHNDPNTEISYNPNNIDWPNSCQFSTLFVWTVGNGSGCYTNDTVRITFYQPTQANAGEDVGVCGLVWRLNAIPSIECSEGYWSIASSPQGSNVSFGTGSQTDLATVPIQANTYGTYEFVWAETNAYDQNPCRSFDTVKVEFIRIPNVSAGADTNICGKFIQLNAEADPAATYGSWHPTAIQWVDTLYSTTEDPASQLRPDAFVYDFNLVEQQCADTVQFVWQQYVQGIDFPNVQCVAKDTMYVHFYADIQAQNQTNVSDSICGRFIDLNSAQTIYDCGAYGYWVDSLNTVLHWWQVVEQQEGNGPNTIAEVGGQYGTNAFAFVIQNGGTIDNPVCADTSDFTTVTFLQKPQVNACPNCNIIENVSIDNANGFDHPIHIGSAKTDTICLKDDNSFYLLFPDLNYIGDGSWSKSLNGINFANGIASSGYNVTNEPNDTVFVDIYNSAEGNSAGDYYILVWKSENSSNGCSDSDTLLISFAKQPSGDLNFRRPFCYGQDARIWAAEDYKANPTHFEWSFDEEATIDSAWSDPNTPDSIYSVKWPQYNDCDRLMHEIRLVSSNDWGCTSSAIKKYVEEPPLITPQYVNKDATCSQANGVIKVLNDSVVACGDTLNYQILHKWLNSTIPNFNEQINGGYDATVDSLYSASPQDTSWLEVTYTSIITNDTGWIGPQVQCVDTIEVMVDNSGLIDAVIDDKRMNDLNNDLSYDSQGNLTGYAPLDVTIYHNTPDAKKYKWIIRDEDGNVIWDSKAPYPNYTFAKGSYQIDLIVTSKEGCIDTTLYKFIMVDSESFIKIPNVFTPNADGYNDYFQVYAKSLKAFKGVIMNRWGKVLYEWTDWTTPDAGWDGKIAGDEAAPGVYYYVIRWKGMYDDEETEEKGTLELVRSKD